MSKLKTLLSRLVSRTPIQYFPTVVRKGLAKGARWTLFPYSAYWRGETEMDVEAAIRLHGSLRGSCCWDLGTHFGIYTVGMAMAVGPEGQVAGFEPDPVSFKRCQRHVAMNRLHWVKLFNAAVSATSGSSGLILSQGLGATTSHLAYDGETSISADLIQVRTIVLDELVKSGEIRPPQFIKVDVEGHGAKALSGSLRTIEEHRPTLVMSFHSQSECDGTRALLEPMGYRSFTYDGNLIGWAESVFKTTVLRPKTR